MSALRRALGSLPAQGRRPYSSYSSFKSGGGRYFNSAKVSKSAVVAAKDAAAPVVDPAAAPGTAVVAQDASHTGPSTGAQIMADLVEDVSAMHAHPVVSAKDFKLHQFFSLHRPLLLLHTPPALFTPGPPLDAVLSAAGQARLRDGAPRLPISVFEDCPADSAVDADAEAARQLARGLTMNRVAPAVAWEAALARLGLDPARDQERIASQAQMDRDWEDVQVVLDSTKRKRRQKMKKHKLKKRRKATRASRLKLK